jgi:mercuric ion transport protein
MTVKEDNASARSRRVQTLLAAGGLFAALAALSCCILPIALLGLGVSGAWIGNVAQLAPYQPYFIAATLMFVGTGYWLAYRSSQRARADDAACARPLSTRLVMPVLIVATILVIFALDNFLAELVR